ncbi:hypothetical protein ACKFKF_09800 [Phormidesmis sp. 146-12]
MVFNCQFTLSSPASSSTASQTISQTSPSAAIAPPTPPVFSGNDMFYIIIALSVLIRVIVNPPDQRQK